MAKSMIPKTSKGKQGLPDQVLTPKEPPRFALPSRKQAMDFFYSNPRLQLLYAERVKTGFEDLLSGKSKTYPVHLNTHADIAEFIFNQRSVKIDSVHSVAEKFLDLCIHGPSQKTEKRKRQEDESRALEKVQVTKAKQVAKPAPKQKATAKEPVPPRATQLSEEAVAVRVGKYNIHGRPRKMCIRYDVLGAPNFLSFFPTSRTAVFSSIGGLHDVTCAICAEIGHYNAPQVNGAVRKLDLGQKAWVAVLHDITDAEGYIPGGDVSALLAVRRHKEDTVMDSEVSAVRSTELKDTVDVGVSDWGTSGDGGAEV